MSVRRLPWKIRNNVDVWATGFSQVGRRAVTKQATRGSPRFNSSTLTGCQGSVMNVASQQSQNVIPNPFFDSHFGKWPSLMDVISFETRLPWLDVVWSVKRGGATPPKLKPRLQRGQESTSGAETPDDSIGRDTILTWHPLSKPTLPHSLPPNRIRLCQHSAED